jgi:hypothetical protein
VRFGGAPAASSASNAAPIRAATSSTSGTARRQAIRPKSSEPA